MTIEEMKRLRVGDVPNDLACLSSEELIDFAREAAHNVAIIDFAAYLSGFTLADSPAAEYHPGWRRRYFLDDEKHLWIVDDLRAGGYPPKVKHDAGCTLSINGQSICSGCWTELI